jgi:hypothetical protein
MYNSFDMWFVFMLGYFGCVFISKFKNWQSKILVIIVTLLLYAAVLFLGKE